jgi:hypothetical protein
MDGQRSIRIGVIAASVAVLLVVVGLAFLRAPTAPTLTTAGGALPIMYEFTTDT